MPWPMSQDYNEAIQNPVQCFTDPELKQGEVVCNALALPQPCSGNFADVYAVQSGSRKWAVKCFTRQIPGLRDRYAAVSAYLQQVALPFMVDFRFLEQGIRVRGQWYPVLKMQWVEGFPLNTFVRNHIDKPPVLQSLGQIWLRLAAHLHKANLAHGDLQHGNVLLVPGRKEGALSIKLVDYDGMCVPALELLKSMEVGHPCYQHPQRLREGSYGLHIDRFSCLAIYTALRSLALGGRALWDQFDNGDNLLFSQKDFESPSTSPVFQTLGQLKDPQVHNLVQTLAQAAQKPLGQTPLLEDLVGKTNQKSVTIPGEPLPEAIFGSATTPASNRQNKQRGRSHAWFWAAGVLGVVGVLIAVILFAASGGPESTKPKAVAQADTKKSAPSEFNKQVQPTPKAEPKPDLTPEPKPEPKDDLKPDPKPSVSPLDMLDPSRIPAEQRFASQPKELVAVIGGQQWKTTKPVTSVSFSKDGQVLAAGNANRIVLTDIGTITTTTLVGHNQVVSSVSFAPGGRFLASAGGKYGERDGEVKLWDLNTRKENSVLRGHHPYGVSAVAWSADGTTLASGSYGAPLKPGEVKLWDARTGRELSSVKAPTTGVHSLAFSPDATMVAVGYGNRRKVGLLDLTKGQRLSDLGTHSGHIASLAFGSKGILASGSSKSGEVTIWDTASRTELTTLMPFLAGPYLQRGTRVAISPDGAILAAAGEGERLILWNINTPQTPTKLEEWHLPSFVWSLAFAPDSRHLAAGMDSGCAYLFRLSSAYASTPK